MKKTATLCLVLATVFSLGVIASPAAQAQTYSVIHTFSGGEDGATPGGSDVQRGCSFWHSDCRR